MTPITSCLCTYLPLAPPPFRLWYRGGGTGPGRPTGLWLHLYKRALCESACSPPGLLLPHPAPVSDARTARTHRVWDTPQSATWLPCAPDPGSLCRSQPLLRALPCNCCLHCCSWCLPMPRACPVYRGRLGWEEIHLGKMINWTGKSYPVKRTHPETRTHRESRTHLE